MCNTRRGQTLAVKFEGWAAVALETWNMLRFFLQSNVKTFLSNLSTMTVLLFASTWLWLIRQQNVLISNFAWHLLTVSSWLLAGNCIDDLFSCEFHKSYQPKLLIGYGIVIQSYTLMSIWWPFMANLRQFDGNHFSCISKRNCCSFYKEESVWMVIMWIKRGPLAMPCFRRKLPRAFYVLWLL